MDCACAACSVAVWADGALEAHRFLAMSRGHAAALAPMVREVMAEAGVGFERLDRLAVTVGPGGFTGVRIGLSMARGLALAAALPLVGVTTFEAVAAPVAATGAGHAGSAEILAAIDSKRGDVFLQRLGPGLVPRAGPVAMAPGSIAEWVGVASAVPVRVAGNARSQVVGALRAAGIAACEAGSGSGEPDARDVAALASGRPAGDGTSVSPVYLRPPDARLPGNDR